MVASDRCQTTNGVKTAREDLTMEKVEVRWCECGKSPKHGRFFIDTPRNEEGEKEALRAFDSLINSGLMSQGSITLMQQVAKEAWAAGIRPSEPFFSKKLAEAMLAAMVGIGKINSDDETEILGIINASDLASTDEDAWNLLSTEQREDIENEWRQRNTIPEKGLGVEGVIDGLFRRFDPMSCDLVTHLFFPYRCPDDVYGRLALAARR